MLAADKKQGKIATSDCYAAPQSCDSTDAQTRGRKIAVIANTLHH
jgi:hypothetical protein